MQPSPVVQQVTFLYCRDLEKSVIFYRDIIGLQPVLDQGACLIFRVAGEAFLGLCTCSEERSHESDGVTFTFVTEDVDAWHRKLAGQGVQILEPPSESESFKIYRFFARDPEGHLLEFQRFLDPAWPAPATLGSADR